ncbi:MOSC N-terminal beta barrel domain-containing protein [Undibacterium sp. Jales W-56]|uniref:MOSC domain-containing protein n=1 Tax=Undibacterium sp. Jales W-56 TaxID=2897325 RepID=UPI0021CEBA7F|nr:MOSC N-terminal beta barrel domain-containing protein [Undibacterium sp. Jales W-56]MCU6435053.1 MOSC N-terminal beta barrel domain-containing protein [Undibacterium sp. Jales W-56]
MPTVTALSLYPIKSCAGISLASATVSAAGLSHGSVHDREWMLVDQDGLFISQREYPRMALIRPEIQGATMILRAPGMPLLGIDLNPDALEDAPRISVQVWDDVVTARVYDQPVSAWFSQVLATPCRLVRFDASSRRLASRKWTGEQDAPTHFADGYPLLLTSTGSLEDLNQKLVAQGRPAIPMDRFRPNIVLSGIEAFEEDYAGSFTILHEAGEIQLQPVKPCTRCTIPAVDQLSGEAGPDPVDILQTYRANPLLDGGITFGMNLIVRKGIGSDIHVGDQVDIQLAF